MSAEGKFLIYCLEIYKTAKKMNGKQIIELFKRYRVTDFIMSCFEALHTTGAEYIIEDIDLFIEERKGNLYEI